MDPQDAVQPITSNSSTKTSTSTSTDCMSQLPTELQVYILSKLDAEDLIIMQQVSKQWYAIVRDTKYDMYWEKYVYAILVGESEEETDEEEKNNQDEERHVMAANATATTGSQRNKRTFDEMSQETYKHRKGKGKGKGKIALPAFDGHMRKKLRIMQSTDIPSPGNSDAQALAFSIGSSSSSPSPFSLSISPESLGLSNSTNEDFPVSAPHSIASLHTWITKNIHPYRPNWSYGMIYTFLKTQICHSCNKKHANSGMFFTTYILHVMLLPVCETCFLDDVNKFQTLMSWNQLERWIKADLHSRNTDEDQVERVKMQLARYQKLMIRESNKTRGGDSGRVSNLPVPQWMSIPTSPVSLPSSLQIIANNTNIPMEKYMIMEANGSLRPVPEPSKYYYRHWVESILGHKLKPLKEYSTQTEEHEENNASAPNRGPRSAPIDIPR
eukprot:CAMPEP_0184696086 /NCGR_PEP_ID=MMETSP0313-20130426/3497_1 /TAXON_ID=2792 /ORGANISM="Porphyridium aerugineum, Strain SAG 1380-2" /LENGTH=440 /DNA_ID=CAMNT_0027154651 /DNA_START=83 /DNA_END=1405 /DNA_ORIENTATION=+